MRVTVYSPVPGSGRWYQDRGVVNACRLLNHEVVFTSAPRDVADYPGGMAIVRLDMGYPTSELYEAIRFHARRAPVAVWMQQRMPEILRGVARVGLTTDAETGWARYDEWARAGVHIVRIRRGCDFSAYGPTESAPSVDLAYCGRNTRDKARLREWIEPLLRFHSCAVTGDGWIDRGIPASAVALGRERVIYHAARVVPAVHEECERTRHSDLSQRVYDAVACGVPVVCDDHPAVEETFGRTIHVGRTQEEYARTVRWALDSCKKRHVDPCRSAREAWKLARDRHNLVDIVRVALREAIR